MSCADSAGYCNTDSLSVSHWRGGTRALDPVIESEAIPPSDLVAARPTKNAPGEAEKSPPASPIRNEEAMTVQLCPSLPANTKLQASLPNPPSPTQQACEPSDFPQQTSSTGSAEVLSARVTSAGGSASGNGSAPGAIRGKVSKAGTGATQHARNVSTVSSTGASPEYEEDDLDDDWRSLLEEVNTLLASKNYTPIRNARCAGCKLNVVIPCPLGCLYVHAMCLDCKLRPRFPFLRVFYMMYTADVPYKPASCHCVILSFPLFE
jgi:hypothetical protein